MIRCVRIWTAKDGNSEFEEGTIDLSKGERGDVLSGNVASSSISFRETKSGGTFAAHDAPTRQFVLTLSTFSPGLGLPIRVRRALRPGEQQPRAAPNVILDLGYFRLHRGQHAGCD
jgi:hypothetical protein